MWLVKKNHLILEEGLAVALRIFAAASLVSCDGEARSEVGLAVGLHPKINTNKAGRNRFTFSSIPEIHKLDGHGKFVGAHGGDDGLQFVAALAVHAHLVALNLRRHLELAVADEPGDLLGHRRLDALLDLDGLLRVAERRNVRVALLHALEADAALGESADDHFVERADLESVLGGELDLVLLQNDLGLAALEIEAVGQLFFGL